MLLAGELLAKNHRSQSDPASAHPSAHTSTHASGSSNSEGDDTSKEPQRLGASAGGMALRRKGLQRVVQGAIATMGVAHAAEEVVVTEAEKKREAAAAERAALRKLKEQMPEPAELISITTKTDEFSEVRYLVYWVAIPVSSPVSRFLSLLPSPLPSHLPPLSGLPPPSPLLRSPLDFVWPSARS